MNTFGDNRTENQRVNLIRIKQIFNTKFPNNILALVLLNEPDKVTTKEFLAKVGTWLAICDIESNKNEKEQVKKGGI